MPKKKQSHTGFRNGALFCFNCGGHYEMQLPQPVRFMADIMKDFEKNHNNCPKTWQPPVVDQSLSEGQKAVWWATGMNGERGTSSECVFFHIAMSAITNMGFPDFKLKEYIRSFSASWKSHPSDPDDFRRCYLLLETVPEWKEKLLLMKPVSEVWSKLVDHWGELTEMLETAMKTESGKAIKMHNLMKKLGC